MCLLLSLVAILKIMAADIDPGVTSNFLWIHTKECYTFQATKSGSYSTNWYLPNSFFFQKKNSAQNSKS